MTVHPNLIRLFGVFDIVLGTVILLGQEDRFSDDRLSFARNISPWWTWGLAFIVIGLVEVATARRWHWFAWFVLPSFFYVLFSISVLTATQYNPTVSFFGVAYAGFFFFVHICGSVIGVMNSNKVQDFIFRKTMTYQETERIDV